MGRKARATGSRGSERWCWFEPALLEQISSTQRSCALAKVVTGPFLPVSGLVGSGLDGICFGHVLCKGHIGGSKPQGLSCCCFSVILKSNKWFLFRPEQSGLQSVAAF